MLIHLEFRPRCYRKNKDPHNGGIVRLVSVVKLPLIAGLCRRERGGGREKGETERVERERWDRK